MVDAYSSSQSNAPVLVTGASGFVAAHVLTSFLDHGYYVRGTVRSEAAAEKVRKSHGGHKNANKLSFAIVEDVAASGAFDEAVKGVQGVIHTASPFQMSVENNERDLLDPAIKGTTGILASIKAHNPGVRRVVITSSFAAMLDLEKGNWPDHTYKEADWNPVTYETAKSADGGTAYCASKTFAEQAAYDFVEKEKPNFTVSTICPPMVYGPVAHTVTNLSKLNTSAADIYRLINGSEKEVPPTSFYAFVDVRDVGEAHRLAYENPRSAGQRYLIASDNFSYQMICDIIRKDFPELKSKTPEGKPGSGLGAQVYHLDNSRAKKQLGMSFIPLEKTINDTVNELLRLEKDIGKA